ncbi:hypothetical protein RclHR1_18020003 [Rhizophagus clarus]|uniref:Uncharacterized protein n=1 Tax=Rhizophagus clarus TaxID=94130 RepID=A0A2Z6QN21_9GLOM|nr:hypothetical protein RclHR1_18020003 [Rhizophagus clarus]
MIFLDDKHHCKVGEPGFSVVAVERGARTSITFKVADHDFTKMEIMPNVAMICNIPESINTCNILLLDEELVDKPVLCLYTDGRPDHHCTYTCVQLSYICLFIALDLNYFVAIRTLPQHSWKNPVERIILILNLGLQSVSLMQTEMNDDSERLMSKCGIMNKICKKAEKNPTLKVDLKIWFIACLTVNFLKMSPSKHLSWHQRLKWKDSEKQFSL